MADIEGYGISTGSRILLHLVQYAAVFDHPGTALVPFRAASVPYGRGQMSFPSRRTALDRDEFVYCKLHRYQKETRESRHS
jgi:hypothetical protein